ncbi:MAG: hypothetical protein ACI4IE_04620 [Eubacterium sp.]
MKFSRNSKRFISIFCAICVLILSFSFSANAFAEDEAVEEDSAMVEGITVADGYFLNDFQPDMYYYDVYMEAFTYNLSISLDLTDPRFEYTITGDDTITADNDSENIVTISVYDPLNIYESVEYYLNVYVGYESAESIEWTGLSYLDVENGIFSPQFSKYRITYYAILENKYDSFESAGVNYRLLNPDASVEIDCRDELNDDGTIPEGKRVEYTIKVTESNGKTKTYYLNLYRKAAQTSSISDTAVLSNIKINGGAVEVSGFSSHKSYYDIKVPKEITNLDIQAYPADRSDIVRVLGPTSMNDDEPIFVSILVTSPTEDTFSIYTLRLSYDSFVYTEKYSSFQLLVSIVLTGVILFAVGFFVSLCIGRIKKAKEYNLFDIIVDEQEDKSDEGVEDEDISKV